MNCHRTSQDLRVRVTTNAGPPWTQNAIVLFYHAAMSLGPTDPQEKLTQPGEICEALGLTKLVHREPKRSNGPFEKIIDAMWEPIRASRYSSFLSIPKLFDEYRGKIKSLRINTQAV